VAGKGAPHERASHCSIEKVQTFDGADALDTVAYFDVVVFKRHEAIGG